MVLGMCLRNHKTSRKLSVLTGDDVTQPCRLVLSQIFDEVCEVSVLDSGDEARLAMMKRPELGVTLTKLHCWNLTRYSKCVFMDADTLCADPGGVSGLLSLCSCVSAITGNIHCVTERLYATWQLRRFGHNAKVIHFLGERKPWDYQHGDYDDDDDDEECSSETGPSSPCPDYIRRWWSVYKSAVLPLLSKELPQPLPETPSLKGRKMDNLDILEIIITSDIEDMGNCSSAPDCMSSEDESESDSEMFSEFDDFQAPVKEAGEAMETSEPPCIPSRRRYGRKANIRGNRVSGAAGGSIQNVTRQLNKEAEDKRVLGVRAVRNFHCRQKSGYQFPVYSHIPQNFSVSLDVFMICLNKHQMVSCTNKQAEQSI
ncbi:Glycogenin-1 [Bagarius yarrelli]|uniref:Glycogenin-1 n=1 Tax=Bagarius yarrelli TaxID=175774 RepID=A0A556VBH3_BAGYA|nr:Glycogenin-1 [Bagarius yarrelli]